MTVRVDIGQAHSEGTKMLKEFKEFAMRGNVVDMAVGIVIGAAFTSIVKSLVDDIMMPAVGRGFFFVIAVMNGGLFNVPLYVPNNIATVVIITMLLLFAWKYKKLTHQATIIGVAINLTTFFHKTIGSSEMVQDFLKAMILYR